MGSFTAADVPSRFDVVINGEGYLLADSQEQKGNFGLTAPFVPRTNVQGDYGDNQQDFWLTWSQNDWSLGEQQKYSAQPEEKDRKFWDGLALDVRIPGEVTIRQFRRDVTPAAVPLAGAGGNSDFVYYATSTNLYHVIYDGTVTNDGAHGLGASPSRWGLVLDQANVYLSTTTGGTVGVRRWNGAAFSTFSATGADALAFLNNALYGYSKSTGQLIRYSTAGAASTIYTWQTSNGTAITGVDAKLVPFGGKLLILRYRESDPRGADLWLYDGNAPAKIAEFPPNFNAYDCEVLGGTIFIGGSFRKYISTTLYERPAIYHYTNGTLDILWQASDYVSTATPNQYPALGIHDGGLIWYDAQSGGEIRYYNATDGSVSAITGTGTEFRFPVIASGGSFFAVFPTSTTTAITLYPHNSQKNTGAAITHSLVDFNSSLTKYFKGVKIDADIPAGAAVDIYRILDDLTASPVLVQAGAVSGTEYAINASGRSIAIALLFTRGTDTNTAPKIKRVSVRALPIQPAFKKRVYILNLGGKDHNQTLELRDESKHLKDGLQMFADLETAAAATAPFTIVDTTGSYTGVIENLEIRPYKPEEFTAIVTCRSV